MPAPYANALAGSGFGPTVNQGGVDHAAGEGDPPLQSFKKVAIEGLSGFDFNGHRRSAQIGDHIHFVAVAVPPEMEPWALSAVKAPFDQLGNHKGFEDGAPQGVVGQLSHLLNAQQPAQQAAVIK